MLKLAKYEGPTNKQIERALKVIEARDFAIRKQKANATVKCRFCKKTNRIRQLTYIQTYWYSREAYNEDWIEGEGRFVCLKCDQLNRLYDQPEVEELKEYFYTIEKINTY